MDGFEEIRHLGRGAFGEVALAKRIQDGALCAVKHIRRMDLTPTDVATHRKEVEALQALSHPCVLRYFDSMEDKHSMHIVTEYADAGDLQQLLKRQQEAAKTLEAMASLAIFAQIIAAVAHVHEHRIIHRDLKPANVFLTSRGLVKLGDFGVAKVLAGTTAVGQMTCVGSPVYMAPEIVGGEPYGPPCDMWSLGVILYELCTLRKPFEGRSLGELALRISAGCFKAVDEILEGPSSKSLAAMVNPVLDCILLVDHRARATTAEVLRIPVVEMFVSSMMSCIRCLKDVFSAGCEYAPEGACAVADSDEASRLEAAGKQALQFAHTAKTTPKRVKATTHLSPPPIPTIHAGPRQASSPPGGYTDTADSLAFTKTSAFADSEISFNLTSTVAVKTRCTEAGDTLDLGSGFGFATIGPSDAIRDPLPSIPEPISPAGGELGSSFDAAMMRNVLGDAIGADEPQHINVANTLGMGMGSTAFGGSSSSSTSPLSQDVTQMTDVTKLPEDLTMLQNGAANKGRPNGEKERGSEWRLKAAARGQAVESQVASAPGVVNTHWEVGTVQKSPSQPPLFGAESRIAEWERQGRSGSGRSTPSVSSRSRPSPVPRAGFSSEEEMEKSVTWPCSLGPKADSASAARRQAHHRSRMAVTTPPAGRPSTPECERARRAEKERNKSLQRNGAMTIPFFDGGPQRAPPQRFVDTHEANVQRQKDRTKTRGSDAPSPPPHGTVAQPHTRLSSTPERKQGSVRSASSLQVGRDHGNGSKTLTGSSSAPTLHAPPSALSVASGPRSSLMRVVGPSQPVMGEARVRQRRPAEEL